MLTGRRSARCGFEKKNSRLSRLLGLLGRQAFKVWKDLGMGAPLEYLQGTFAILSEALPFVSELFSDRLRSIR